jgi:hypothetical protein
MGLETRKKKDDLPQASILKRCVSLGVRMIFERKVRWALGRVKEWLTSKSPDATLTVEWLALSVFDNNSQFALSYKTFVIDVSIERDEMTVTRYGDNGEYRKVTFHSDEEFEIFLKLELQKRLNNRNGNSHSS